MELDKEWLTERLEKGHCEMTGLPFVLERPSFSAIHPFTPSIDKVVPSLGYTKANSRLVIFAVNAAKQDWSDDTLLAVAAAIHSNSKYFTGKQMQDDNETTTAVAVIAANAVLPSPTVKPVFTAVEKLVRVLGSADLSAISEVCGVSPNDVLDVLDNNRDFLTVENGRITALFLPNDFKVFSYECHEFLPAFPMEKRTKEGHDSEYQFQQMFAALGRPEHLKKKVKGFVNHRSSGPPEIYVGYVEFDKQALLKAGFHEGDDATIAAYWRE